jgi:hypothetical protein
MIVSRSSPFLIDREFAAYENFPPHSWLRCVGDMTSREDYQSDDRKVAPETLASELCEGGDEDLEKLGREHN